MKVVDIEEAMPHIVSEVICLKCLVRFWCVRPTVTTLKSLECEKCGQGYIIETGEVINE